MSFYLGRMPCINPENIVYPSNPKTYPLEIQNEFQDCMLDDYTGLKYDTRYSNLTSADA